MPFTREQALAALKSWNPAPVFIDAYATKQLPESLEIYVGPPEEFFLSPDSQAVYTKDRIIPILDDGNFGLVTFHDPGAKTLVELDLDSPEETIDTFRNWQQYLASLMLRIGESDDDDESVRRIADLVQFGYTDELFAFWEASGDSADADFDRSRRAFLAGIVA